MTLFAFITTALLPSRPRSRRRSTDRCRSRRRRSQHPENTEALYRLGLAYLALGDPAAPSLRSKADSQDPDSLDGKLLLSRAFRLSGEPARAKRHARQGHLVSAR